MCRKWENMRKPMCPRTLSRFSETFFLLSNQIHQKLKTNQNILFKPFYNKMRIVKTKQKLSDEEKATLVNFYKQNKALWSLEVNVRNKEGLMKSFQRIFLIEIPTLSRQLLIENRKNTKIKLQRKSGSCLISYPF